MAACGGGGYRSPGPASRGAVADRAVRSAEELELMRVAGRLVAECFTLAAGLIRPGVNTAEIDRAVADFVQSRKARCAFKGYRGYPAHVCTSVNDEVVHGIPGRRVLREGDILSLDVGVAYEGYCGDGARTFPVGEITPEAQRLLTATEDALYRGLAEAREGQPLSNISHAIQRRVEQDGFSVVRELVGHGIGRHMHEDPQVPNYGPPGHGPRLRAGMTIAVEPMVNAGRPEVNTLADGWTVVTRDGSLSAHYEHTVVITENGVEILTTTGHEPPRPRSA
jgi:methionyl aminopeptidase